MDHGRLRWAISETRVCSILGEMFCRANLHIWETKILRLRPREIYQGWCSHLWVTTETGYRHKIANTPNDQMWMLGKNATTPVLRWDDLIIDQDESEEGRDCLYKSGGAVSWGHFVALPLCVLGQFSRITSAVMRRRRHHQTSSRRGEKRGQGRVLSLR